MSRTKTSRRHRHDAVSGAAGTAAVNGLGPTVVTLSEQPYANRWARRHVRTMTGATLNVPRLKRQPALNEPYRRAGA